MKAVISTETGVVILVIEGLEQYNLDKPMAQAHLVQEVKRAVREAKEQGFKR